MSENGSNSADYVMGEQPEEPFSDRDQEIAMINRDFSQYTKDANFRIYFKIVHNRSEAEQDIKKGAFHPDFVHQFFPDHERIFGYKNPIIKIFYSPSRLKRFFKFEFDDKLVKEKDGINADDVLDALSPVLQDIEYTQDINQFIKDVESEEEKTFKPPGEIIGTYVSKYRTPKFISRAEREQLASAGEKKTEENGKSEDYLNSKFNGVSKTTNDEATKSDITSSSSKSIVDNKDEYDSPTKTYNFYHATLETKRFDKMQANMQSLIMWFIESANIIDVSDPRWDFFLVYEKSNASDNGNSVQVSTEDRHLFVGYASVYRYYAYPDKMRPRIAQILVIPPYRKNGVGTALLDAIYNFYRQDKATLDITVEDPDEDFIVIRDFLDCRNCIKLDSFQPDKLKLGWTKDMAKECQEKLKLCERQARKVYEILKLRSIDSSDEDELRAYRLEIKNRLNIPNQRLKMECDKVLAKGCEVPEELKIRRDNLKWLIAQLEDNFQELFRQYQHTINKLNRMKAI